ncbi:hypothetical protein CPB84DRAFT_1792086 [Gymnopilus junonius]|uniref:DUF6534 domain-containing protein n=1 Tax=Gymnopilus junonius TaxID=109634 RepID=A0A9P5NE73_GYMJU|nr:hypothetical protein CPB84DRAFT_1792086 [Gymnopilus junonius]
MKLLGYLFHWGLFGVLVVQVYLYHLAFPNDPMRNKGLVYSVLVLDILQTIIITRSVFHIFGDGYGNFSSFNDVELAWLDVPVLTGIISFIAQGFYAYRIKIISQSYWVAGVILFFAVLQLGGAIAAAVILKNAVLFSRLLGRTYSICAGVWNGGSALCDVIIAIYMTYYISSRSSGALKSTRNSLRRVIRLVIETGSVTGSFITFEVLKSAIAILNLVLENIPGTSYYLVPSEILAKVYSNSMLVVLNSRMKIGADLPASENTTTIPRVRTDIHNGTDGYELGEGVMITREEIEGTIGIFVSTTSIIL